MPARLGLERLSLCALGLLAEAIPVTRPSTPVKGAEASRAALGITAPAPPLGFLHLGEHGGLALSLEVLSLTA